jgi:multicomponent Na+:H+ antiporter subunit D
MGSLPPAIIPILAACVVPFLKGKPRNIFMLAVMAFSFANLLMLDESADFTFEFMGYTLNPVRVDALAFPFAVLFHLAGMVGIIFSFGVKDNWQHSAGLLYIGSAIAAVCAGDLISLLISWELLAVSSVVLIFARRTRASFRAGMRYFFAQLVSGLLLFNGVVLVVLDGGDITFGAMSTETIAGLCLFFAFGLKAGFPLLHNWLTDGYPEATPTGAVFLCACTTKVAIYALARSFAGTEILVTIGTVMACFPIFYAVIENDLRRVLGYSMINQLGFMIVGIGIGTELAINGAVAHAFNDVFFKGLLFMSMGAVLHRTGTINGSELGGLYKSMPKTAILCCVGAASISAFPLFSGFVSKSMIMVAAAENGHDITWFLLLFAAAGVFHHAGIKIPFFAFFAHDSGKRCKEAPKEMLWAMTIAAGICIFNGSYPWVLYDILPFVTDYDPYDTFHVVSQLQLLFFSALAFVFLQLTGIYPPELRSVNIDSDWVYRKILPWFWKAVMVPIRALEMLHIAIIEGIPRFAANTFGRPQAPTPGRIEPWGVGPTVLLFTVFLLIFLVINLWM